MRRTGKAWAGGIRCHVLNRGNGKITVSQDDADCGASFQPLGLDSLFARVLVAVRRSPRKPARRARKMVTVPIKYSTVLSMLPLAFLAASGCASDKEERTPDQIVESWRWARIHLPTQDDIAVFRHDLPDSFEALRAALRDGNKNMKMRAAFVAGALGPDAADLLPALEAAFNVESVPLVRIYMADAFGELGIETGETVEFLAKAFQSESDPEVRTHVAGSLIRLSSCAEYPNAWEWIRNELSAFPPEPPGDPKEAELFWDRRFSAILTAAKIRENEETIIAALRHLGTNDKTPNWIVNRVLSVLEEIRDR